MQEQVQSSSGKTESKICLICHKAVSSDLSKCPDDGGDLINTKQDRLIGETFANRYKILSIVGQGGMSTVYKAQHTYMERIVAVKLLHPHLVSDPVSVQRFQQEAKAAASLCHANIITVFDFGVTEDGLAFLVMDYLEGPSLGDLLDRAGAVPPDEAVDIFRQVLKGLSHAHRKGVVHRDLKPRNLVLAVDEDGTVQVKIVDFGIAKMVPQDGAESQHLTQTGEVFGSPIYMSPEQCSGQPLDLRSDIYSWGCVMFETLTGSPPFLGKNAVETMSMHVNDDPPNFKEIAPNANIPRELQDVVIGCLRKDPKKRYQNTAEILEALPVPGGIPPKQSQTGTVVMRLGDMVQNTTPNPISIRTKTPRKTKKHLVKISSRGLATTFGIAFMSLFSLIAFFPFTVEEVPGTPMQKMWWQTEMWTAGKLMELRYPGAALTILKHAVYDVSNFSGPGGKPMKNYDSELLTLTKQAEAYLLSGQTALQDETIEKIVQLDRERYDKRAIRLINDMAKSQKHVEELIASGDSLERHIGEKELNWAGQVRHIVEIARRLDANYAYGREYQLLFSASALMRRLYGDNFIGLADIYEQMADCLLNQDRVEEIGDKELYSKIKNIRLVHAKEGAKKPEEDENYIRSALHLGQWQRDRSQFAEAQINLENAVKMAEKCKKIKPDQLAEYYGSLADLYEQTKNFTEAQKHRQKAQKMCSPEAIEASVRGKH
ncbi:MAG: serine/threonine-protein kinase [Candidatus Melainabacteria bacterium]|nr:serine/threonine-protein kinase [Candidatus Melainabacteria bacterium]